MQILAALTSDPALENPELAFSPPIRSVSRSSGGARDARRSEAEAVWPHSDSDSAAPMALTMGVALVTAMVMAAMLWWRWRQWQW